MKHHRVNEKEEGMAPCVWILNHYAEEPKTGTGLRHYNFAKYLQQLGWQPIIFAASTIHKTNKNLIEDDRIFLEQTVNGIPFVFIRARNYWGNGMERVSNMLDYYRGMKKSADKFERPDIILASSVHPLTWQLGKRFSKRYGVPWVCEVRDLWPYSLVQYGILGEGSILTKLMYAYERWSYKKSDAIIFTIPGGKSYIQSHYKAVDLDKVFYINNGVDLEAFEYNKEHFPYVDSDLENDEVTSLVFAVQYLPHISFPLIECIAELTTKRTLKNLFNCCFLETVKTRRNSKNFVRKRLSNVVFKGRVEKNISRP